MVCAARTRADPGGGAQRAPHRAVLPLSAQRSADRPGGDNRELFRLHEISRFGRDRHGGGDIRVAARYHRIGADQLLFMVQYGAIAHERVMKTIEILGTRVLPELQRWPTPEKS